MKKIEKLMIVGAGIMGHGIALVCAKSGLQIYLVDKEERYLEGALTKIKRFLKGSVDRGKMAQEEADGALANIVATTDMASVAGKADLIIEAIIEDQESKSQLFKQLNELCDETVIFASNTSQFSITSLGRASGRPDRFVGMHWFNPPPLMKLIEIPRGYETSDATVAAVENLAKKVGKVPMSCQGSPGFVVSRILNVWYNEGMNLVDEGVADIETIDSAIRDGGGFRMGPMELRDLVGLDTALLIHQALFEAIGDEKFRPCRCLRDRVAAGHFGRKTGKGFYDYNT